MRPGAAAWLAAALLAAPMADAGAGPMTVQDLRALPRRPADVRIAYGKDTSQFGELRVPAGPGPHPLVVLIHGGCWKADYGTLADLAPMADALKDAGIASWTIEYRRTGQPGAGWPGTYRDIGAAIDALRTIAPTHRIDLKRVIALGHSAGGHLALWATSRAHLPADSAIAVADPLPLRGAIDFAGSIDLRDNIAGYEAACGGPVVTALIGGTPEQVPDRYRQASPTTRLPLGVRQRLIWGEYEEYVPPMLAQGYTRVAGKAGDDVQMIVIPKVGHFDLASPRAASWPRIKAEIVALLGK